MIVVKAGLLRRTLAGPDWAPRHINLLPSRRDGLRQMPIAPLSSLTCEEPAKALSSNLQRKHKRSLNGTEIQTRGTLSRVYQLLGQGQAPRALQVLEKQGKFDTRDTAYIHAQIIVNCRCLRLNDAESLVSQTDITESIALEFIAAYSYYKNAAKLERWTDLLLGLDWKPRTLKEALELLVRARMWSQVRTVIGEMTSHNIRIPSDITAACMAAAKTDLPPSSVAAVLSQDGAVINSSHLRLAAGGEEARKQVSQLLDDAKVEQALEVLQNYHGAHELSICVKILHHLEPLASKNCVTFRETMEPVVRRVLCSREKSSRYLHFMLRYYFLAELHPQLWDLVSTYQLMSQNPKISPLKPTTYRTLWHIVKKTLTSQPKSSLPISLRELLVVTLLRAPLVPQLFHDMLRSLSIVGDLQSTVTLLEYASEKAGLRLNRRLIKATSLNQSVEGMRWLEVARLLCDAHSRDLNEVQHSSKDLRAQLSMR